MQKQPQVHQRLLQKLLLGRGRRKFIPWQARSLMFQKSENRWDYSMSRYQNRSLQVKWQSCRYSVIPKTKKCLEDIDAFIKENHFDECGIIYCLSRMDCEKVSEKLQHGGYSTCIFQKGNKAIVVDEPGVTRDRLYGRSFWGEYEFMVVDTGGVLTISKSQDDVMDELAVSTTIGMEGIPLATR